MNIGVILKVISHFGQLSGDLKDIEQAAKDLFAGKLSHDDVAKLLSDIAGIFTSGLVSIPGVDSASVVSTLTSGESIVSDVMLAVSDVKSQGVSALVPDLRKITSDLLSFVKAGTISDFGGHTAVQAQEVLEGILKSFPAQQA